jgi:DNA gyrase/topoisomerase IV subunit A
MLMKFVPFEDSEIDGFQLPKYLPTPIPLSLMTAAFGIGFGINTEIPQFTIKSLVDAYIHNDYKRLRLNCDWKIDYKLSEFKQIWEEGYGNIYASFNVEQGYSLDGVTYGTIITGMPTKTYKPGKLLPDEINDLISQGKIIKRDESSKGNGNRLFLARAKRVSIITDDWIYEKVRVAMVKAFNYRINVSDDDHVGMISIKEWIDVTFNNYLNILRTFIDSNIKNINWKLTLLQYADDVMNEFQKSGMKSGAEEISKAINVDLEIVKDIMKQSLNSWRRMDKDEKVKKLNGELDYWKKLDPKTYVLELLDKLN